jgi:hypothetical protein
MGKPKRTSNTRASSPISCKELFKSKSKDKVMKSKGKKLMIEKRVKKNKYSIKKNKEENEEELEVNMVISKYDNIIKENNNMTNVDFKNKVFEQLDFVEIEQNIEDIKM